MELKKIAIMQPYFFPYLGYFSLIKHTDLFILLDEVQFIRHGWIERNRILKPGDGWQYISIPLIKHSQNFLIKEIKIKNAENWKNKITAQLDHYKKKAPYFTVVSNLINDIFSEDFSDITTFNHTALIRTCKALGLESNIKVFSEMEIKIEDPKSPDEWALNICKALGDIKEYRNPSRGRGLFDNNKYTKAGIDIKFHSINLKEYDQRRMAFEPRLSIIDVMMFNNSEEILNMLDEYELS